MLMRRFMRPLGLLPLLLIVALGLLNRVSAGQTSLVITNFTVSPSSITGGTSVMAQLSVTNDGTGKGAMTSTSVNFWLIPAGQSLTSAYASRIGQSSLGTVQRGKTVTVVTSLPVSPNLPSGTYQIVAEVTSAKTAETTSFVNLFVDSSSTSTASTSSSPDPTSTTSTSGGSTTTSSTTTAGDSTTSSSSTTASTSDSTSTTPTSTSTTSSTSCNYYAAPNGSGDGLSSSKPFAIQNFWSVASPGTTLCLLDGVYTGAANMITPPPTKSGTAAAPITIRALRDGAVLLDGEFLRDPVSFVGNSWWVIEGINAKNGTYAIFRVADGSNNNVFRRIVAWDVHIGKNAAVFWSIASAGNLLEDGALFGAGQNIVMHSPGGGGLTLRRVWARWEGSTSDWGGYYTIVGGYENAPGFVCENCIATHSGESMPQSYSITDAYGVICGQPGALACPRGARSYTDFVEHLGESILHVRGRVGTNCQNARVLGSLVYVRGNDRYFGNWAPNNTPGVQGLIKLPGNGFDLTCTHVRHTFAIMHPSHPIFANQIGFRLNQPPLNPTDLIAANNTSVVGNGNAIASAWTNSGFATSTSTAGVPNAWTTTGAGANLCFRWLNQVQTTQPLWPWPMNERIKQATATAGAYSGPCPGCSGGRAARTATDVIANVESLLGPIPAQCKGS
jgi:hypothetical protein